MRIRSFTTIELMVAIVISGVVIGIAQYALQAILKIYSNYELRQTELREVVKLESLFFQDFSNAKYIEEYNHKTLSLYKESGSITYTMSSDNIVRSQENKIDTFKFEAVRYEFVSVLDNPNQNRIISDISIHFNRNNDIHHIYVGKQYDSATLMKLSSCCGY